MIKIKKGSDLKKLAGDIGISITQLASELGYESDVQIKRLIKQNTPISRKIYLSCVGLQWEKSV